MATLRIQGSEIGALQILESAGFEAIRTTDGIEVADDDAPVAAQVLENRGIVHHVIY